MEKEKVMPRYEIIAYKIAQKIHQGFFAEKSKLSGRTLLSSEFNVSSETIRKALVLLSNYNVVLVKEQSGVFVLSKENAKTFLETHEQKQKFKHIGLEIEELLQEQHSIQLEIQKKMRQLKQSNELFPFEYFTIDLSEFEHISNETIASLDLYQKTGGLVIAYELNHKMYQIPNPNTLLNPHMIIYMMGNHSIKKLVINYFKKYKKSL
ncbi:GntR family transcriptional regulator [Mycoplasmatota bacterium]|nr:GntR family transcriptional regulator [Mycoplasmatota bacterium]